MTNNFWGVFFLVLPLIYLFTYSVCLVRFMERVDDFQNDIIYGVMRLHKFFFSLSPFLFQFDVFNQDRQSCIYVCIRTVLSFCYPCGNSRTTTA